MKKISLAISFNLSALMLAATVFAQTADIEKDKQLVEKGACVACHGTGLNAPVSPNYLELMGQHGDYICHALLAYQTSNSPLVDHSNAIMAGQVNSSPVTIDTSGKPCPSAQAELRDITAYVGSLPGSLMLRK